MLSRVYIVNVCSQIHVQKVTRFINVGGLLHSSKMDIVDLEKLKHARAVEICSKAMKIMCSCTRDLLDILTHMRIPNIDDGFVALYVAPMVYFIVVVVLSLFATIAIIYSMVFFYRHKAVIYVKLTTVVSRIWSRLNMHTFMLAHFLLGFYYFGLVALLLAILAIQEAIKPSMTYIPVTSGAVFNVVLIHFGLLWHFASMVLAQEDINLVGSAIGKRVVAFCMIAIYMCWLVVMFGLFGSLRKHPLEHVWGCLFLTVLLLTMWMIATILGTVIHGMFFFIYEAYHSWIAF